MYSWFRETKLVKDFMAYSEKINWKVFILICIFTSGSWIDICGVWSEMSLIVEELPEGWRLPSILNISSSIGLIGPFIFLTGRWLFPKRFSYGRTIYGIFFIGIISCLFLTFTWNKTYFIFNERRSVFLYLFNLTLSLLDGISSVTFLPWICAYYSKEYIISNYFGEAFSALLPSVLAFIQGTIINEDHNCDKNNSTLTLSFNSTNPSYLKNKIKDVRFSVSVYFFLMMTMLSICALAFFLLNFTKIGRDARKCKKNSIENLNLKVEIDMNNNSDAVSEISLPYLITPMDVELLPTDEPYLTFKQTIFKMKSQNEVFYLMILTFLSNCIIYGTLPSLISYSTLPYGNLYFHLSNNLGSLFLPIPILISIWNYKVSLIQISIELLIVSVFSIYIMIVAIYSPNPPFVNNILGGPLIVICWILVSCMIMRIRCITSATLDNYGSNMILINGLIGGIGQTIGGILIYICVDVYDFFQEKTC